MWRNFRCGKTLDVQKFFVNACNLPCFVAKLFVLQYTLFCRETCFVAIYAVYAWRKIEPNRKDPNIQKSSQPVA